MILRTGQPGDLMRRHVRGVSTRKSQAATVRVQTKKYLWALRWGGSWREGGRLMMDVRQQGRSVISTAPRAHLIQASGHAAQLRSTPATNEQPSALNLCSLTSTLHMAYIIIVRCSRPTTQDHWEASQEAHSHPSLDLHHLHHRTNQMDKTLASPPSASAATSHHGC